MAKQEIWFKRSDGHMLAAEEGSEAFKKMIAAGEFTLANKDGSEYTGPAFEVEEESVEEEAFTPLPEAETRSRFADGDNSYEVLKSFAFYMRKAMDAKPDTGEEKSDPAKPSTGKPKTPAKKAAKVDTPPPVKKDPAEGDSGADAETDK